MGAWAFPLCCFAAIYHLIYGRAAGLRPLRSKAPQVIVLSPIFSLWLKPAPRGGMGISALLLRSNLSFNLRQSRRASPVAYGGAKFPR